MHTEATHHDLIVIFLSSYLSVQLIMIFPIVDIKSEERNALTRQINELSKLKIKYPGYSNK